MGMFVHICATDEVTSIHHVTMNHVTTNPHLKRYIDAKLVNICAKTQRTAIFTSHYIAMYVPEANVPATFYICVIYFNSIYDRCMCICVSHMKSLAKDMCPMSTLPIICKLHLMLSAYITLQG